MSETFIKIDSLQHLEISTETFYHFFTWLKAWKRGYMFKIPFFLSANYHYSPVSSQIIPRVKNNNYIDFYTLYNLKTVINRPLKVW